MTNTLQVSDTDGKDIFGAKSPVLICQVKYAYAYLNHKEYIYIYISLWVKNTIVYLTRK